MANQPDKSKEALSKISSLSLDYCFPYRIETESVLKFAIENNTKDAIAFYLLGNLLYDKRPVESISAWNEAVKIDNDLAIAWRNLAFGAFYHDDDANKAIELQEKAIGYDQNNPIWYNELADYYDNSEADFKDCLSILEKNVAIVKQDINAPKSLVKLYNLNGEYDKAIQLLMTHHFRTWEGGRVIYWHYVDTHVLRAKKLMAEGKFENALEDLQAAMLYPENLEVGKPLNDERNAMIYYYMAQVYEKMGKKKDANRYYDLCAKAENSPSWPDLEYYQGMANKKLGNTEKADKLFDKLLETSNDIMVKNKDNDAGANQSLSKGYYYLALSNIGVGNDAKAEKLLSKSVSVYKNNLWAKHFLLGPR